LQPDTALLSKITEIVNSEAAVKRSGKETYQTGGFEGVKGEEIGII